MGRDVESVRMGMVGCFGGTSWFMWVYCELAGWRRKWDWQRCDILEVIHGVY
jgi:hypothetical protein